MKKVTIEDISRHTGLSRGTVSRALNDRPDISSRTKQRVVEACRELHYVPSHAARTLATGRTLNACVFVDDLGSQLAIDVLRGVLHAAADHHYTVGVVELGARTDQAAERFAQVGLDRIDCAILCVQRADHLAAHASALAAEHPLATTTPIPGVACDHFAPDEREAGRVAARLALRHEGACAFLDADGASPERWQGFAEVLAENGRDVGDAYFRLEGDPGGARVKIRAAHVVVGSSSVASARAAAWSAEDGRSIGADVRLIAFGGLHGLGNAGYAHSVIDPAGEELGRRAFETLLQRAAKQRSDGPAQVLIAPRVIEVPAA